MSQAPVYVINTVDDFRAVPSERLADCLAAGAVCPACGGTGQRRDGGERG